MQAPQRGRLALVLVAVLATALLMQPSPARATWRVAGGGSSAAQAAALTVPSKPSATGSGLAAARTFTVSWQAPPPGEVPVAGYIVRRQSSLLGAGLVSVGTCSGITLLEGISLVTPTINGTTFSCTDVNVVSVGLVQYTVTPVYRRWVGPASAWSAAVT